jgi:hypothetical protein
LVCLKASFGFFDIALVIHKKILLMDCLYCVGYHFKIFEFTMEEVSEERSESKNNILHSCLSSSASFAVVQFPEYSFSHQLLLSMQGILSDCIGGAVSLEQLTVLCNTIINRLLPHHIVIGCAYSTYSCRPVIIIVVLLLFLLSNMS